ncbi:hypothetical protein E3U23_09905 [Erythrobacter litoralis]|nr:hypothetical protein [Erythrobacter litoralis]
MLKFALPAALAATGLAVPAAAQQSVETGDDSYNMVIVYGDDACPESTADVIVVCARKAEGERYRIPEALRYSDNPANQSWAERVESFEMVGAFGTMSCSPVGAGGFSGCTQEMIREAYADKDAAPTVRFSQIIENIRQDRLATIDEDAAATQRDVEMIEREYMQRLERERAAELPDEAGQTPPTGEPLAVPPANAGDE